MRAWAKHARLAPEVLPAILGERPADPTGWRALLQRRMPQLPPQLLPRGWFQA